MPTVSLLSELRRRINDTRHIVPGLTIGTSETSTSASVLLEITDGTLIVSVTGTALVQPVSVDLTQKSYETIGALAGALSRVTGLITQIPMDADEEHLAADLEEFGPIEARGQAATIKHRYFSDWELDQILEGAVRRHNPGMTVSTIPSSEHELVLLLAQAEVNRRRVTNAAKRRGTDTDVNSLLAIAAQFESTYDSDLRRLSRAIEPVREAPEGRIEEGDIMLGKMWRKSARTGFLTPMGAAQPPPAPRLLDVLDGDEEDTNVRVRWQRSEDEHFHSYELWRDTQENVERQREATSAWGVPTFGSTLDSATGAPRASTAKLVFRAFGGSSNYTQQGFATFIESYGQLVTQFNSPELEPETDYFFRMYVTDQNMNTVGSRVVRYRTKPLRTRWHSTLKALPVSGPAGTVVTCEFDTARGVFTTAHKLFIGGKTVTPTIVDPYTVTFVVPSFLQTREAKDLTVESPTGLKDILFSYFTVTT